MHTASEIGLRTRGLSGGIGHVSSPMKYRWSLPGFRSGERL
jgi:hypothetical protein